MTSDEIIQHVNDVRKHFYWTDTYVFIEVRDGIVNVCAVCMRAS